MTTPENRCTTSQGRWRCRLEEGHASPCETRDGDDARAAPPPPPSVPGPAPTEQTCAACGQAVRR